MLDSHLIVKTFPVARKENIVFWKDYRITVLTDRLFRVENNKSRLFRDKATQVVWYRNTLPVAYTKTDIESGLEIQTKFCKLIIKENREDCRIMVDGKVLKIDNAENLKGTYRTLDLCDGSKFYKNWYNKDRKNYEIIDLGNGVCSRNGVAVFDDANSLTLNNEGQIIAETGEGTDEYIFVYGDDYRGAIKALYDVTGKPPLVPRFALGNWWSRYYAYSDKEYLKLLNKFEERKVPLSVATIDMDWHYSNSKQIDEEFSVTALGRDDERYTNGGWGLGWTGYTWNKHLFPDYRGFLKKVQNKGLKITLNLHPADGIRFWEDAYEGMAKAMGVDPRTYYGVKFDISSTDFINSYFSILHKPYELDGVTFWWIDWQQGTYSQLDGLDPLWALNHYHYLDNAKNHSNPLILSRFCGVGSHRYPIGFSGDTFISWDTLSYLPYFTATASNIGYTWWSHDIGGHMAGEQNGEMYLRHLQYGVFSPINRLHCSSNRALSKEPWVYLNGTGKIAEEFLRFRHALLPYLYTCSYRTHKEGIAIVEPLYYEWKDEKAYEYTSEYLFGEELLVIPITSPTQQDGYARVKAWLPKGKWTDIFTGDFYNVLQGGKEITLLRSLDSIPVLIKAGGILPLSADEDLTIENPKVLEIRVFEGNGEFILFEDGRERGVEKELFTKFVNEHSFKHDSQVQTLTITMYGDMAVIPSGRVLKIRFWDIPDGEVKVYKNGKEIFMEELLTGCVAVDFSVEEIATYKIEVIYPKENEMERLFRQTEKILLQAEGSCDGKMHSHWKLLETKTITEFIEELEKAPLLDIAKLKIKEIL